MAQKTENIKIRPGFSQTRVGLFGGTFDPVHVGHVGIVHDIKKDFNLDKIMVIPSATPPHKKSSNIASAEDRLAMAKIAFADKPCFEVSDIELKRKGPSYTMDTVFTLSERSPDTVDLFLLIGTDAFFDIHTWHRFRELLDKIKLIVMTRPGDDMESNIQKKERAGRYLTEKITKGYSWNQEKEYFNHDLKKQIFFHNVTQLDISSTNIRRYIKENFSAASPLLNSDVATYIEQKGLYQ